MRTAREVELHAVAPLLDALATRGFAPETAIMDKGYDYGPVHEACMERGTLPIIARRRNPGETERPKPLACEHGEWTFAGADFKRKRTKWRCPSGCRRSACAAWSA